MVVGQRAGGNGRAVQGRAVVPVGLRDPLEEAEGAQAAQLMRERGTGMKRADGCSAWPEDVEVGWLQRAHDRLSRAIEENGGRWP